jgi:hypothetical protein
VPIFHEGIDGVAQKGAGPRRAFRDEPAVGVGHRAVRGIAAETTDHDEQAAER